MIRGILDYEINNGVKEVWLEDDSNDLITYHVTYSQEKGITFAFLYEGCPVNTANLSDHEQATILTYLQHNNIFLTE